MKHVTIKYNPYKITTEIRVDGQEPKSNSGLNVAKLRLQEWIERLPEILVTEYRDKNFEIDFTGTEADYADVVAAVSSEKSGIYAKCTLHATPSIDQVEREVDSIFAEIQAKKDVPELSSPDIMTAFKKAKDSRFEVNVVATMSSGKSTLINALLGQQLMPAANEATTATIVKIIDTDSDHFSAVCYDENGRKIKTLEHVTYDDMKQLNNDPGVALVELRGKIPFVKSTGMKLVLVDTPGPNNSRDEHHREMTYNMISNSDKSLVLFVMNGQQLGIDDEKILLDYICQQMKKGGKQSRERFIFAVSKMDSYRPSAKNDGPGCIRHALNDVKKGLEQRGITNPNLFPVASLPALQVRLHSDDEDDTEELGTFQRRSDKYEEMRFEDYYDFSNLPQSVRQFIDKLLKDADEGHDPDAEQTKLEVRSGIVSIEQAISMYVNKYARTQKINDLVMSFNGKLEEMAAIATIRKSIAEDKGKAEQLHRQIEQIRANIKSAREAQTMSKEIDKLDVADEVNANVKTYIKGVRDQLNRMMIEHTGRIKRDEAMKQLKELEEEAKAISAQIEVEMGKILNKAYKTTLDRIIAGYAKYLDSLNLGMDKGALSLSPVKLVSASLGNLNRIVSDNTETVDEGRYETFTRRVKGGTLRKIAHFVTFGLVDDHTTETYEDWVSKNVDYVDMTAVADDYLTPMTKSLKKTEESAKAYMNKETDRLKCLLKEKLAEVDKLLDEKLVSLAQTEDASKATAEEIAAKEAKLKWMLSIQKRVQNLVEF